RARISASTTSMPFLSIVRSAALVSRRLIQRLSLSTQNRRRCRLGMKRRLVLLLAWETLLPTIGAFPVTWQTRAIARSSKCVDWCRSKAEHYARKRGFDQAAMRTYAATRAPIPEVHDPVKN